MNELVKKIIDTAIAEIGVKESPPNSNKVKYNTDYYGKAVSGTAYPWCAVFCYYVFKRAGLSHLFYGGKKTAYCPTVESYYKNNKQWYSTGKVGDLVLFEFNRAGRANHIGIVEKVNADGTYTCIEGNTSTSNENNGGAVMRRVRKKSVIRGFARPNYGVEAKPITTTTTAKGGITVNITLNQLQSGNKGNQVKTLQRLLVAFGYSVGKSGADGDFGAATLKAVKEFQKAKGLTADGVVGAKTWEKLLK